MVRWNCLRQLSSSDRTSNGSIEPIKANTAICKNGGFEGSCSRIRVTLDLELDPHLLVFQKL